MLVNPQIEGSIEQRFQSKTPREAGLKAYKEISQYFSNNMPEFSFSLRSGNDLYHYHVREKINKDDKIKYVVKQTEKNVNEAGLRKFIEESKNDLIGGGKYFDDSSDSDSSSEEDSYEYYRRKQQNEAIYYWKYFPGAYPYGYYYTPQFIKPLTPYIYIKFSD